MHDLIIHCCAALERRQVRPEGRNYTIDAVALVPASVVSRSPVRTNAASLGLQRSDVGGVPVAGDRLGCTVAQALGSEGQIAVGGNRDCMLNVTEPVKLEPYVDVLPTIIAVLSARERERETLATSTHREWSELRNGLQQ